jgi:hypothetical protein
MTLQQVVPEIGNASIFLFRLVLVEAVAAVSHKAPRLSPAQNAATERSILQAHHQSCKYMKP